MKLQTFKDRLVRLFTLLILVESLRGTPPARLAVLYFAHRRSGRREEIRLRGSYLKRHGITFRGITMHCVKGIRRSKSHMLIISIKNQVIILSPRQYLFPTLRFYVQGVDYEQ